MEAAADLVEAAASVRLVAPGGVPEAAAPILDAVGGEPLVALGGGRVIDAAKAVASVRGSRAAAIPTTMSGAEMTAIHRAPAGAEAEVRGLVRPTLVIADPKLMASQPEAALRASSMNALAHGADSLYTPYANPVSRMAAQRGAAEIARALDADRRRRDASGLALGSLLCGYAIDSALFGVHQVVCQSLVRVCGTPHAETNAAVLPRAMAFMATRAPEQIGALAEALGCPPAEIEARILELGGSPPGLGALGCDPRRLDQALDAMLARRELAFTPGAPGREQLRELIERAW
jgi:alcohol dehydrogenase class IV